MGIYRVSEVFIFQLIKFISGFVVKVRFFFSCSIVLFVISFWFEVCGEVKLALSGMSDNSLLGLLAKLV